MTFARTSNPQISDFVTGTNTLVQDTNSYNLNYSQGFTTGTTLGVGFSTVLSENNNLRSLFNPALGSDMSLTIRQRLLQGFGRAVNNRNIRIAKNNQEVQDLQFELQLISTVTQLQNLYWDLVAFIAEAEGRQADLELSELLVRNTKRQVELGLQPGFEITRVEAETTLYRQQLLDAEDNIRRQENIIKNAISKFGPSSTTLLGIDIVPVDEIEVPENEPIEPLQDLIKQALRSRPGLVSGPDEPREFGHQPQGHQERDAAVGRLDGICPQQCAGRDDQRELDHLARCRRSESVLHRRIRHGPRPDHAAQLSRLRSFPEPQHSLEESAGAGRHDPRTPAAATNGPADSTAGKQHQTRSHASGARPRASP